MRIVRPGAIAVTGLMLLVVSLIPAQVLAGTSEQPEITDTSGDSTSGKKSRDIIAVWFDGETNVTFNITMNITALDSYTGISDIQNIPTTEYETYFRAKDKNYAAVCKVPVHGPGGLTIQGELRSVTYGNGTDNTTETNLGTLTPVYSTSAHTIRLTVSKTDIGDPPAASHLTNIWAGVWNKNWGESTRSLEDRAPNSGYGRDYIIRGASGAEIMKVDITVDNSTQYCKPNEAATFKLNLYNNGTSSVNVLMVNSTPTKGWNVSIRQTTLLILQNSSRFVYVDILPPRSAKNGTTESIAVWAILSIGNQTTKSDSVIINAKVNYIPPVNPDNKNVIEKFVQWVKDNPKTAYPVIAVIIFVVVAVAAAALYLGRKKEEEDYQPPPIPRSARPKKWI